MPVSRNYRFQVESQQEPKVLKRQRKHRQKRRAEGKCEREGCLESPGAAYYCPTHKRERRERARNARSGSLKRGPRVAA